MTLVAANWRLHKEWDRRGICDNEQSGGLHAIAGRSFSSRATKQQHSHDYLRLMIICWNGIVTGNLERPGAMTRFADHQSSSVANSRLRLAGVIIVALLLLNIFWVSNFVGWIHPPETVAETDHYRYIAMAEGPIAYGTLSLAHEPPFCYRLLTPYLAFQLSRTGLSVDEAFYILSSVFLFLFLFTVYCYLLEAGIDLRFSLLGVLIVGLLQGAVRWYFFQYWMTDPAALFLLTLSLLLIKKDNDSAFRCLAVVGVTARETYLLIFPYYFLYQFKRKGLREAVALTLKAAVTPLIVFSMIRYFIIPSEPAIPLPALMKWALSWRLQHLFENQIYFCTIGSLGVLVPLLLVGLGNTIRHFIENYDDLAVVVMVIASLALTNSTDRVLAYCIPVILPIALRNANALLILGRVPFIWMASSVTLVQFLHFALTKFRGTFAISLLQPTNVIVSLSMAVFWLVYAARLLSRSALR